jgi:hypothetical protein
MTLRCQRTAKRSMREISSSTFSFSIFSISRYPFQSHHRPD